MSDPGMPNLTQVIEGAIDAAGVEIRVALPGVVKSVGSSGTTADIQPAVRRSGASEHDPVIPDVPICFPRSGKATVSFPIAVGDHVRLVFQDRDIASWLSGGGGQAVNADTPRVHDLTDVLAVPINIDKLPTGASGNFYAGGPTLTSIISGAAIKLGVSATDYLLKGTTFHSAFSTLAPFITAWLNALTPIFAEWKVAADTSPPGTTAWKPAQTTQIALKTAHDNLIASGSGAAWPVFLATMTAWLSTKSSTE